MPSHQCHHHAVIRWLLFVCLLYSGSRLEAQIEAPTPVPKQEAPSLSNGTSDDSEPKIQNYQLKHAKAAEVLKLFKQLHGIKSVATIDERTNSIVFLANENNVRELRESLAFLDSDAPHPINLPTPVLKGSSPQAPNPAKSKPAGPFRKFTFKHAKVADALKILRELAGSTNENDNVFGFAVDERTNSVIWKVKDEWESQHWEETLLTLDGESSARTIQKTPSPYAPTPASVSAQPTQTFIFSMGFERGESLESLKQRYNQLEQQTHQLADKLKQSKSPSESERSELQTAVRKSFQARQALQRAELADLAQRMKSMQQSIDMRDKLADKVVQRRVEDLLNPNLKWDAGKMSEQILAAPNQSSSNPAMPLPPSPSPASVSARYVPGEPTATVIRKRIQGRWTVQTHSDGNKDALPDSAGQVEVEMEGNLMRYLVGKQDTTGPILLAASKDVVSPTLTEEDPLPIDFIYDPNGDPQTIRGIIACDGTTLSICMASDEGRANKDFRPSLFVPGTKVTLLKCRRAEPETANAVSVDQTTWKSAVQQATSKLLLAYRVPQNIDPSEGPKVIALIDVDYQGKREAGDLKEEIYEWIENNIPVPSPGRFTLLSRRVVALAMMETKLRPSDLVNSCPSFLENRQRILEHVRRHDVKLDSLLIASLKHIGDSDKTRQNQFEVTLEGFIDAQTSWFERVTLKGKASGPLKEPESYSLLQFATPQDLLAAVEQHGNSGSYEDFVTLFNDEGVRDLAGSLLMSAMMQTSMDELARQQKTGGLTEVDPGTVAVRKVLQRWLPQSLSADQQQFIGKGLSTMMSSIGGVSPDQAALKEFVISMRKSVEGITDHRKFCVEMMQAYEKLTTKPFVYFGKADQKNEWQISQFGDRAIGTLIDGSPGMATTITLQQASGDWRISSLFNELVEMTKEDESGARPITPAMAMQQRLQGEWDVKVFQTDGEGSGGQAYQVVIRGNILLLQTVVNGKVIGVYPYKLVWPKSDHPYEVDVVHDPNDNNVALPGRIACDNNSFQIVFGGPKNGDGSIRRPSEICPVENSVYVDCTRNMVDHRRAPIAPLKTSELSNADLSTPQASLDQVPDDQTMKSGVPVDELAGEAVIWNDVQNGLSLGYRITGDEWRILGKDVKVELWVQNHGDKDVKFQDNMRADPEFGLRVKLKDAKGEDHNSNFWPNDTPPFGFHRLLPPGHSLKVKEFTISLFLPENDFSHAKGHFIGINPGAYEFHCELELPGFSATGEGGKQLTPAAGEWTGKLTTRGLNVEVIAPDAPAPKPHVESVVVAISQDGEISLDRKKMPLDELKTRAARNAKKRFTIQADEDVPYAKVIVVIEALKASGVTQFSFATSSHEILSAEPVQKPRTDSTAPKPNNPDDSAPPIQPQAEQDGALPIKTIPVTSKELRGIWFGASDRTGDTSLASQQVKPEKRVDVIPVLPYEWDLNRPFDAAFAFKRRLDRTGGISKGFFTRNLQDAFAI